VIAEEVGLENNIYLDKFGAVLKGEVCNHPFDKLIKGLVEVTQNRREPQLKNSQQLTVTHQ
jgi:hypothetical protein